MHKPARTDYPPSPPFHRYLDTVEGEDVTQILDQQRQTVENLFETLTETQQTYRYAPGKWSPKEMLGHLTDTERIFSYRMLAIARGEQASLPGFDENVYAETAQFDRQPLAGLLHQYQLTRLGTLALLASFDQLTLDRRGTANGLLISVRSLAWLIAGHERHHLNVLNEKYGLPPSP